MADMFNVVLIASAVITPLHSLTDTDHQGAAHVLNRFLLNCDVKCTNVYTKTYLVKW